MTSRRENDFGDFAREVGDRIAAEVSRARARNSTERWRADQVKRHKSAARVARRHQRQRDRADRARTRNLVLSAVFAVIALLIAVVEFAAVPFVLAAGLAVLAGGRAAYWQVERRRLSALPPPPQPPPLPPAAPRSSATLPYVRRVDRAAQSWAALEPLLLRPDPVGEAVVGGPADRGRQASEVGHAALAEIHAQIADVQALEVARATAPPEAIAPLDAAVAAGVARLDEAVPAFERFVVAASELVHASSGTHPPQTDSDLASPLRDATDALAGLAAGLREMRGGPTRSMH